MTEYINIWKNYFNFSDRTSVRGYWIPCLINIFIYIVCTIIGVGLNIRGIIILSMIYELAVTIPSLALTVRRLRDADENPLILLMGLIPIVGIFFTFIIIYRLCGPSVQDNGVPQV